MINLRNATLERLERKPLRFLNSSLQETQEYLGIPDSEIRRNPYVENISQLTAADNIEVSGIGIFRLSIEYSSEKPMRAFLTWTDSPLSKKDWDTVKPHDLHETISGICEAVSALTGIKPDKQRKLKARFKTKWGIILVEGEERSYSAAAYLKKPSGTEN